MKSLLLAASLVLAAGSAFAVEAPRTAEAVLVSAPAQASSRVIDGRLWRCFGTGCRAQAASAPVSQSAARECRRVAAQLGELAAYRSGKHAFTPAELASCNAEVAKRRSATELAGAR